MLGLFVCALLAGALVKTFHDASEGLQITIALTGMAFCTLVIWGLRDYVILLSQGMYFLIISFGEVTWILLQLLLFGNGGIS